MILAADKDVTAEVWQRFGNVLASRQVGGQPHGPELRLKPVIAAPSNWSGLPAPVFTVCRLASIAKIVSVALSSSRSSIATSDRLPFRVLCGFHPVTSRRSASAHRGHFQDFGIDEAALHGVADVGARLIPLDAGDARLAGGENRMVDELMERTPFHGHCV